MRSRQKTKFLKLFICLCFSVYLTGCGNGIEDSREIYLDKIHIHYADNIDRQENDIWPENELKEKFAKYWYKRLSGEIDDLWLMEAPHFRFMVSAQRYHSYLARSMAQLPINVEIREIKKVSEYKYNILCQILFTRSGQEHSVAITDRWVWVDNQWFHVLRDPLIFPFTAGWYDYCVLV